LVRNLKEGYGSLDAIVRLPFRSYMFAGREQNPLLSTLLLESFQPQELENVEQIAEDAGEVPPTIDDWPFVYLAAPGLPRTNLFCLVLMTAAMLIPVRRLLNTGTTGDTDNENRDHRLQLDWHSLRAAILGAAFMAACGKSVMTLAFNYG